MKQVFYTFIAMLLVGFCSACEQKEDDYYTNAIVTLQTPDSIKAVKMQGTVALKNLSNGRVYSSSNFKDSMVEMEVLRGTYMLDAEGTLLYSLPDGSEEVKYFRASSNYIEIVEHPARINVEIIFM